MYALTVVRKYARIIKLSKDFPGPPALPIVGNGHTFFGKQAEDFICIAINWMDIYGQTIRVWFGPELNILTSDMKFVEPLLSSHDLLDKATEYDFLRPWLHQGLLVSTGRKWFGRRKIITPAFHFRILEQFVDVFDAQSNILVKLLSKYSPEDEVELYPYITLCALDVICETAMGVSCKAQINSDSKYVQAVKTISMVLHKRMFDVQYRLDFLFRLTNLARIQNQALKIIHDFSNDVIVARRNELLRAQQDKSTAQVADENDNSIGAKKKMAFLDILLQSNIDGKPLSNMDIQEEVDTFMFEGHDTTTSAITFCLYNLALYPEAQQKCFEEICDVIGKDKDKAITYTDLNSLNYMELVAKETLRLFPSVPLLGRKVTKECTINGKRIPAGTNIGISPLVLGRMEEIFPQSDKFIPERFDSSMVTGGDKMNPYCYIPFSAGPRNCIGQKFAMLEIKSVVSKILRHFTVEMAPDQEEPLLVAELILKSKNALKFKLKPRIYT